MLHKKHHEHVAISVWSNGYAVVAENLVNLGPPSVLFVCALSHLGLLGFWNLTLPSLSLIMSLNCGHMGFMNHWTLLLTNPLDIPLRAIPSYHRQGERHNLHHITFTKNYGPFFEFWDSLESGTTLNIDPAKYMTQEEMARRKKQLENQ
ncbi:hypothetical protein HDU91_004780 [Kappamyces sp. JEL0680]|nr:hypothetical protein HDU91_004780 [Kappamyces sp. JEL0680]